MNTEDIIRMAREAGLGDTGVRGGFIFFQPGIDGLERFAALVAAHEREECAKLAERTLCASLTGNFVDPIGVWGIQVAIDIRKRGQA